jgi:hypothetical protein
MRRLFAAITLVCLSWPAYAASAEPPDDAFRLKVLEERDDGQWYGRQHWLYDEENQPQTNAMASDSSDCTEYRIRVPKTGAAKADAGTEIKRVQKCD